MTPVITVTERATARFWSFVSKGLSDNACWVWMGAVNHGGYGVFRDGAQRQVRAYRFSYELLHPFPVGLQTDHLCRNRRCVNPAHLEAVTAKVNYHRSLARSAITHLTQRCARGHDLSVPENVYQQHGGVMCKRCVAERGAARYAELYPKGSEAWRHRAERMHTAYLRRKVARLSEVTT